MRAFLAATFLLTAIPVAALAQSGPGEAMAARLSADKPGNIESGAYSAGDAITFSLEPYGEKFLLRFEDNPETFVLGMDRVALGGRELKYDTGATAIRISVWGGMTLYTDRTPGGLPATRTGEMAPLQRQRVSESDLSQALRDESSHLAYAWKINVRFLVSGAGDKTRSEAFETLLNTDAAIARLVAGPAGRKAFGKRIETIRLADGQKPGVALSGRTLTVRFVPVKGPLGRLSSHAIAMQIGKLLSVPEPG